MSDEKEKDPIQELTEIEEELLADVWGWDLPQEREVLGYRLVLTCSACPEQYDVFLEDKRVGYLRLRHGNFRADYPDCGEETVYTATPKGDGIFDNDERDFYLEEAIKAIKDAHERTIGSANNG